VRVRKTLPAIRQVTTGRRGPRQVAELAETAASPVGSAGFHRLWEGVNVGGFGVYTLRQSRYIFAGDTMIGPLSTSIGKGRCGGFAHAAGLRNIFVSHSLTTHKRLLPPKELQVGTEEKVVGIVSEQLSVPVEEINRDSKFVDDLKADSLDVVELVMAFEDEFGISIPDDDYEKIQTVGDAVDYIDEKS
jgi:acyl carrier protein